jgi:hypothetical protein
VRALSVAIISKVSEAIILSVARERQAPRAVFALSLKEPLDPTLHRNSRLSRPKLSFGRRVLQRKNRSDREQ